jgi:hypothetical protein
LGDINNFIKYFNNYSFSLGLDQIKSIFIFNNLSLEELNRFIDTVDYFLITGLNESVLTNGIYTKRNKYNYILIDLKPESIPQELIFYYPISLLFKFKLDRKGNIHDLSEKNCLERKYAPKINELMDRNHMSLYYEGCEGDPLLNNY